MHQRFKEQAQKIAALSLMLLGILSPVYAKDTEYSHSNRSLALVYHRFGENDVPSTNVTLTQFEMHLGMARDAGLTGVTAGQLIDALTENNNQAPLIVITVDDAYRSFAVEAWPRIKAMGWGATLFIATDMVGTGRYMTWDEIRMLAADGVEIGHHGGAHLHMIDAGIDAVRADILAANAVFERELGYVPNIFAYPYGEYSIELQALIQSMGFRAAFAQVSGGLSTASDQFALPRFAVNERYGRKDRIQTVLQVADLRLELAHPLDTVLREGETHFDINTLAIPRDAGMMNCFASHIDEPLEIIREKGRVTLTLPIPFPPGRARINCTAKGPGDIWYWSGFFFYVPGGVLD